MPTDLTPKLEKLPDRPGVYLFKGARGEVLYVGKASSLQDRVRSYWRPSAQLTPRQAAMLREVVDLDYLVTASPVEALALECNLIKEHRPRYNVRLRDDKNYPYLRIPVQDPWPRVMVVRGVRDDGARYFGPYTRSQALQETLRFLRRHFPFRTCSEARFRQHRERPCLHYFVGRCAGPCAGLVSPSRYASIVQGVISFLEGRQEELLERWRREMEEAAERLEFERAAEIRDRLRSLEEVVERQRVVFPSPVDLDALAVAFRGREGVAQVFSVRGGRLVGREAFPLAVPEGVSPEEVVSSFLQQFYARAAEIPPRVLVPFAPGEKKELEEFLARRRGEKVRVRVPRGGQEAALLRLAEENARTFLEAERGEEPALEELARVLDLPRPPERIEGFDLSNLAGGQAVGVMVVFLEGRPSPSHYRRFRVRHPEGRDDYAMMREVIARRMGHRDWPRPDLILVDGGFGQVAAAREALGEAAVPVVGLAKGESGDWVAVPGRREPLVLPSRSPALQLLRRVRDEAHRFALGYHRRLRKKDSLRSLLEEVPGIGPRRRRVLLARFRSLREISRASPEELASLPGMNQKVARELLAYLQGEEGGS